jgi:gamma-glutamyltranspeptidase/glutathione hydrolase
MKGRELAMNGAAEKQFKDMKLFLGLLLASLGSARDRSQAHSLVLSDRGIVATSQTLASQAGAQVLARGGSAIDAAIAANAQN